MNDLEIPRDVLHALATGDFSKLSLTDRDWYYQEKCRTVGLNPLTQPFRWLNLNGKDQLYALKSCSEQLRKIHGVSLWVDPPVFERDLVMVHVRGKDRLDRDDEDYGFAYVGNLKGEALGNAILKAITKGKNRVTLSICGLLEMDESEVESLPMSVKSFPHEDNSVHGQRPSHQTHERQTARLTDLVNHELEQQVTEGSEPTDPDREAIFVKIQEAWRRIMALKAPEARTVATTRFKEAFGIQSPEDWVDQETATLTTAMDLYDLLTQWSRPEVEHPTDDELQALIEQSMACGDSLVSFGHEIRRLMGLPLTLRITKKFLLTYMTTAHYQQAEELYNERRDAIMADELAQESAQGEASGAGETKDVAADAESSGQTSLMEEPSSEKGPPMGPPEHFFAKGLATPEAMRTLKSEAVVYRSEALLTNMLHGKSVLTQTEYLTAWTVIHRTKDDAHMISGEGSHG